MTTYTMHTQYRGQRYCYYHIISRWCVPGVPKQRKVQNLDPEYHHRAAGKRRGVDQ